MATVRTKILMLFLVLVIAPAQALKSPQQATISLVPETRVQASSLKAAHSNMAQPRYGRFLVRDRIRHGGGNNLYAYAGNNPINFTDADGLYPVAAGVDLSDPQQAEAYSKAVRGYTDARRNATVDPALAEGILSLHSAGAALLTARDLATIASGEEEFTMDDLKCFALSILVQRLTKKKTTKKKRVQGRTRPQDMETVDDHLVNLESAEQHQDVVRKNHPDPESVIQSIEKTKRRTEERLRRLEGRDVQDLLDEFND